MAEESVAEQAEETVALESKVDEATQANARKMGWIPPERYKGDPEKFVDADEYIKRGEEVLPIIKQQKAKLEQQVGTLTGKVSQLEEIITKNQEAMLALEEYHDGETKRKVAEVRKQLKSEIARASEAGDHEALAEATDQLSQLQDKVDETAETGKRTTAKQPPATKLEPYFTEWAEETGWYGSDRRRTALANAIALELRQEGETATGREFLDLIAAEVDKTLPSKRREAQGNPDKVGGGRASGGGGGGRGRSYADLPSEAKTACDGFANQLVGAGRRYKTLNDWRAAYAKSHFEEV